MKKFTLFTLLSVATLCLIGMATNCSRIQSRPISDFNKAKYLGTWNEIGRIDNWFESGLTNVTATYTANHRGYIDVLNMGYNPKTKKWKETKAHAYSTNESGIFKVYFVPFIGGNYEVVCIDPEYQVALVSGGDPDYLWILARQETISKAQLARHIKKAHALGFDTSRLIFPNNPELAIEAKKIIKKLPPRETLDPNKISCGS